MDQTDLGHFRNGGEIARRDPAAQWRVLIPSQLNALGPEGNRMWAVDLHLLQEKVDKHRELEESIVAAVKLSSKLMKELAQVTDRLQQHHGTKSFSLHDEKSRSMPDSSPSKRLTVCRDACRHQVST